MNVKEILGTTTLRPRHLRRKASARDRKQGRKIDHDPEPAVVSTTDKHADEESIMPNKVMKPSCPECGGPRNGRGYSHIGECSLASKVGGKRVKPRAGARNGRRVGAKVPVGRTVASVAVDSIRRMPIQAVIEIRRAADQALEARHGEVKRMISSLKRLLE